MRPQEVLTIYINNAVRLQEGSLFIYLAKLTGLSLFSVQFFAFLCNLSTTFHASDSTRRDQLVYFLGFSSALNAFDTQLGQPCLPCRAAPRFASKSTANMA